MTDDGQLLRQRKIAVLRFAAEQCETTAVVRGGAGLGTAHIDLLNQSARSLYALIEPDVVGLGNVIDLLSRQRHKEEQQTKLQPEKVMFEEHGNLCSSQTRQK